MEVLEVLSALVGTREGLRLQNREKGEGCVGHPRLHHLEVGQKGQRIARVLRSAVRGEVLPLLCLFHHAQVVLKELLS